MPRQEKPIVLANATPAQIRSFHRNLLKWFDANQRDLPWRKRKTPYRIWVSEIMLQQTQVATVIDYYRRFMKQFPSVSKLAAADESEVLKLWEGLGYYRRARQLHKAAQVVVEKHGGRFPKNFDDVLALPGIGRYTAGAILSIACDQQLPILEGNTIRLFARLIAMRADPKITASQKELWAFSESIVPSERAGDFNQALMELGSEICSPKSPKCELCPVIKFCPTFRAGLQEEIPAASKKMKYENVNEAVVLVSKAIPKSKTYLVRLCQPGERWSGLWDFPRFPTSKTRSNVSDAAVELSNALRESCGIEGELGEPIAQMKHAVTRFRISLSVFPCENFKGRAKGKLGEPMKWATKAEIDSLPMSITGRKIAEKCCE